jgi:hypothetical protein
LHAHTHTQVWQLRAPLLASLIWVLVWPPSKSLHIAYVPLATVRDSLECVVRGVTPPPLTALAPHLGPMVRVVGFANTATTDMASRVLRGVGPVAFIDSVPVVRGDGENPTAKYQKAAQAATIPILLQLANKAHESGRIMGMSGQTASHVVESRNDTWEAKRIELSSDGAQEVLAQMAFDRGCNIDLSSVIAKVGSLL